MVVGATVAAAVPTLCSGLYTWTLLALLFAALCISGTAQQELLSDTA